MSGKTWIIFVAVVVVLFGGLVVFSQRNKVDVSSINDSKIIGASDANGNIADHIFGKKDSKVVLVEYGDFQCPGCASAHVDVKAVTEKYADKIAFVFRNFPLSSIHPNARAASAAAEAAGLDGKYWQMHNKIYDNQEDWSKASASERTMVFGAYAKQFGMNEKTFTKILEDETTRINKKIAFDQALGRKAGVSGTPTFFINGKKLNEDQFSSKEALEKTILEALK